MCDNSTCEVYQKLVKNGRGQEIEKKIQLIKKNINTIPDFPKPGIIFKDFFSVLKKPDAFEALRDVLIMHVESIDPPIQAVCGLDARGFLLAPIIALHFKIPLIPIRKKGKLPGKVEALTYELEYGSDTVEVQENDLPKGTKIIVIDDLIATGGTLAAGCELLQRVGFDVVQCLAVIELVDLNGIKKIKSPVHSIVKY